MALSALLRSKRERPKIKTRARGMPTIIFWLFSPILISLLLIYFAS